MSTTAITETTHLQIGEARERISTIGRFFQWCEAQESNRLMWLGIALAAQGCVLTPLAVLFTAFAGAGAAYIFLVMGSMALTLIPNLAAQPTKITIPLFLLSILIDLGVILITALGGLNSTNVYSI